MPTRRTFIILLSSPFVNKPRSLHDILRDLSDERTHKEQVKCVQALANELKYFTTVDGKPTTAARGMARKLAAIHDKIAALLIEMAEL